MHIAVPGTSTVAEWVEQNLMQWRRNFMQVASDATQVSVKTPGYKQFAASPST